MSTNPTVADLLDEALHTAAAFRRIPRHPGRAGIDAILKAMAGFAHHAHHVLDSIPIPQADGTTHPHLRQSLDTAARNAAQLLASRASNPGPDPALHRISTLLGAAGDLLRTAEPALTALETEEARAVETRILKIIADTAAGCRGAALGLRNELTVIHAFTGLWEHSHHLIDYDLLQAASRYDEHTLPGPGTLLASALPGWIRESGRILSISTAPAGSTAIAHLCVTASTAAAITAQALRHAADTAGTGHTGVPDPETAAAAFDHAAAQWRRTAQQWTGPARVLGPVPETYLPAARQLQDALTRLTRETDTGGPPVLTQNLPGLRRLAAAADNLAHRYTGHIRHLLLSEQVITPARTLDRPAEGFTVEQMQARTAGRWIPLPPHSPAAQRLLTGSTATAEAAKAARRAAEAGATIRPPAPAYPYDPIRTPALTARPADRGFER